MSVWPYTTQRWQRLRRLKLCEHPLCEACLQVGRIEVAVAVDHRVPISEECRKRRGGEAFPALNELASLCARCHNSKTRGEQLGGTNYWTKGCDVFGYPLDPSHPWNREKRNEKSG